MNLQDIIDALNLQVLTETREFQNVQATSGYTSDLLSCVMAGAQHGGIWVTLQAHSNIVAVAALLDLSAVIITENALPEPATIEKANEEGIILMATKNTNFYVVGKLWEMGIRSDN
jgi:imidazolonepropionase-like amidohydrolase